MAYRRIDITADQLDPEEVQKSIDNCSVIEHLQLDTFDGKGRHSLLVIDEHAEPILDALREHFDDRKGLRITVQEVKAVWPEPDEQDESDEQAEVKEKRHRDRVSRDELLEQLETGSRPRPVYVIQVAISSLVAAVGMTRDNVTLVIAAMVIAPLLVPNMALALGVVVGDLAIFRRSCIALLIGLIIGLAVAVVVGWIVPVDADMYQLSSRTHVWMSDLVIAVAAGVAGALAVTTGVSASLIGVMVAVALVPPLAAIGLLTGAGEWRAATGAALLLGSNIVCVLLAAVTVYRVQGIRARTWHEEQDARRAVWYAASLGIVLLIGLTTLIYLAGDRFAYDQ